MDDNISYGKLHRSTVNGNLKKILRGNNKQTPLEDIVYSGGMEAAAFEPFRLLFLHVPLKCSASSLSITHLLSPT